MPPGRRMWAAATTSWHVQWPYITNCNDLRFDHLHRRALCHTGLHVRRKGKASSITVLPEELPLWLRLGVSAQRILTRASSKTTSSKTTVPMASLVPAVPGPRTSAADPFRQGVKAVPAEGWRRSPLTRSMCIRDAMAFLRPRQLVEMKNAMSPQAWPCAAIRLPVCRHLIVNGIQASWLLAIR